MKQSEQKEGSTSPGEMAAAQVDADPERRGMEGEGGSSPDRQTISGGAGSGRTDGGEASVEAQAPEKTASTRALAPGEQMEGSSGSETTTGGR